MGIRVVSGELETSRAMTRLVIPSSVQHAWPPFRRVGETVVTRNRQFPLHFHERQEVLTYVTEGFASYQLDPGAPEELNPGSARLLESPGRASHRIGPARTGAIRWFSLVLDLPEVTAGGIRLEGSERPPIPMRESGPHVWSLVGPGGPMHSIASLECREITFDELQTIFQRVGHDRRGFVYALTGRGSVDGIAIETGEAALIEDAAGIAVQGTAGFRAILATAPRPPG